jgi:hypothetical protein
VARGDQEAFATVYEAVAGPVLGLVRSILRDPAQSEEVEARLEPEQVRRCMRSLTEAQRESVTPFAGARLSSHRGPPRSP